MKAKRKNGFVRMSIKISAEAYDALKAVREAEAGETMVRLINQAIVEKYVGKAS